MSDIDITLADEVSKYYDDPLGFVMMAFQWGEEGSSLHGFDGPDEWQIDILNASSMVLILLILFKLQCHLVTVSVSQHCLLG